MPRKRKSDNEKSDIRLAARLEANHADELRDLILESRDVTRALSIDASDVTRIDTPALQVLAAAALDQARNQQEFAIKAPSDAFLEASMLVGMTEVLNLRRQGDV